MKTAGVAAGWSHRFAWLVPARRRPRLGYTLGVGGHAAVAAILLAVRDETTPLSKGLVFMAVVILAAVVGGLGPGILASILGFLIFNLAFIPPYGTLYINRAEDTFVLFVFLALSLLISTIFALESERREAVEARESELEMLNRLSHEMVVGIPGPQTYETVLTQLIHLFNFSSAALLAPGEAGSLEEQAVVGAPPGSIAVSGAQGGPGAVRIALSVGTKSVGLLLLAGDRPPLDDAGMRVLRACCNELALVLERDRLIAVAERADVYRRTDAIRRSLFGAVSHELRSPLAAIKASVTDLLSSGYAADPGYAKEVLQAVDGESDRLDGLITNLLDMSRIESGTLLARIQTSDLADSVHRCRDRVENLWPAVSIRVSVPEDSTYVQADPVFLERVLTNLLENGAKASPEGIEVEARRDGSVVTVRVIDHGTGVPVGEREHVFHPFYELDRENARLGRGLGLAICKGFLNVMQGEIWLEESPGGGATFAFSLPAARG